MPGVVWIFRSAWAVTVHKANPVMWQQICKRDKLRSSSGSGPASISNRGFSQQRLKGLQQNYCVWGLNESSHLPCELVTFVPGYRVAGYYCDFFKKNLVLQFNLRCSLEFWT